MLKIFATALAVVSMGLNAAQASQRPSDSIINVKDHGAIGDGLTDDTDAIQSAAEHAWGASDSVQSGTLYFPAGTYILRKSLVFEESSNKDVQRSIIGDGSKLSEILLENSDGFISWTKSNYGLYFHISDLSLIAGDGFNPAYGVKLKQHHSGNRKDRHISIENIILRSQSNHNYFRSGIQITGGGRGLFSNIYMSGAHSQNRSEIWLSSFGIALLNHYGPYFEKCSIWGCDIAYSHKSDVNPGAEGGTWISCVADAYRGWDIFSLSDEPGLTIDQCHANYGRNAVRINGRKNVIITNCLFYQEDSEIDSPTDIEMDHVKNVIISNNQFFFPTNTTRFGILIKDTAYSKSSINDNGYYQITNNQFLNGGHGIRVYGNSDLYALGTSILNGNTFGSDISASNAVSAPNDFWGVNSNNLIAESD